MGRRSPLRCGGALLALAAMLAVSVVAHAVHPFFHPVSWDVCCAAGYDDDHAKPHVRPGGRGRGAAPCPICSFLDRFRANACEPPAIAPWLTPVAGDVAVPWAPAPLVTVFGPASPRAPPSATA